MRDSRGTWLIYNGSSGSHDDRLLRDLLGALEAAGHWGVPTLVFDGEPFFGQDRIAMAKWRMDQKGLQPR